MRRHDASDGLGMDVAGHMSHDEYGHSQVTVPRLPAKHLGLGQDSAICIMTNRVGA